MSKLSRLYVSILFDKPVYENKDNAYPSVGGFEITTKENKTFCFDFHRSEMYLNSDGPRVVLWDLTDADIDSFPEIQEMINELPNVQDITECYVDLESYEDVKNVPHPVKIEEFVIEVSNPDDNFNFSTENDNITIQKYGEDDDVIAIIDFQPSCMKKYKFN